jgi:hypothetical protein
MTDIVKTTYISIHDSESHNLADSFMVDSGRHSHLLKPGVNKVIIESRDVSTGELKIEEETSNLIVCHGRHWLMQRAFGFSLGAEGDIPWANNTPGNVVDTRTNFNDMYISWFALGSGGADAGAPLQPLSVSDKEYELGEHLQITHGDNLDPRHLRYTYSDITKDYHAFDLKYPEYKVDGEIDNKEAMLDPTIYKDVKADAYVVALVRVTIAADEYNGEADDNGDQYLDINEAGLFVSTSHVPGNVSNDYNNVQLFAKVNFSTFRKNDTRELVFSWYLYF